MNKQETKEMTETEKQKIATTVMNGKLRYKPGVIVTTGSGTRYEVMESGEWRKLKEEFHGKRKQQRSLEA